MERDDEIGSPPQRLMSEWDISYLILFFGLSKNWIERPPAHLDWVIMGLIGFTVGFVGFLLHQLIDLVME